MTRFTKEVSQFIVENNTSQNRLAKESGYSQPYLNLVLNGKRNGSVNFYKRLSTLTGISLDTLKEQGGE